MQAAVDYVAALGGGTVEIGAGVYEMFDSLHLRSNVTVKGQGEASILRKCDGVEVALILDGDYGEEQITVADPSPFRVGMGVTVRDQRSGGFHTTVATIIWQDGDAFGVTKPLNADCMVSNKAVAATTFPVISGYHVENARVEHLAIDGNRVNNPHLNGCRGAGVFLYRGHGTVIEHCVVRNYFGDGISFQQSNDVILTDCLVEGCSHLGMHPGSGSQRPTLKRNVSRKNDDMGIFLCWRVKHGVFEDNETLDNGRYGFSIGHKYTNNLFQRNRIIGNGKAGIHFRNESEAMAGHRNRIENNEIVGNGEHGIRIDGETHDIVICGNRFGDLPERPQPTHVFVGEKASRVLLDKNLYEGKGETCVNEGAADAVQLVS
ncbi:MAG: right-handed parallel beta-helix repeat-containing protein [Candidatus Poribacteria bacterium]|nr:right-handed parallel beta-helix repeat-containing protein [Candidatus Poribacteria bacterium]